MTDTEAKPVHVRAIDAFQAFYAQLATLDDRLSAFRELLAIGTPSSVVLAAADVNCAWAILDARLDLLKSVTNDDAGRDLWCLPTMERARTRLRLLLRCGAEYVARHGLAASALLVQLRQFSARLEEHARAEPSLNASQGDDENDDDPPVEAALCLAPRPARRRARCTTPPALRRPPPRRPTMGRSWGRTT